jgi:acyl dehydratase
VAAGPALGAEEFGRRAGGQPFLSRWFDMPQARIDAFADATEDWQFIHVDPARSAAAAPFGGTVAHGFLTLAMLSAMAYDAIPDVAGARHGLNTGFDRIRFVAPVPAGARLRARFALLAADSARPGEVRFRWDVAVEIEGGERPALVAEWLTRVYLTEDSEAGAPT